MIQHKMIPHSLVMKIDKYLNPSLNPGVFTIDQLDGFLFCLAMSSPLVPYEEIVSYIFSTNKPYFNTFEDVADFNRYLDKYLNLYAKALKNNSLKFPFKIDANNINDDIVHAIQDWCYGFLCGIILGLPDWLPPKKQILEKMSIDELAIYEAIFLVYLIASTLHRDKLPKDDIFEEVISHLKKFDNKLINNIIFLPHELRILIEYGKHNKSINMSKRLLHDEKEDNVKISRNDPCPCGSGLKYKKCCGKNL